MVTTMKTEIGLPNFSLSLSLSLFSLCSYLFILNKGDRAKDKRIFDDHPAKSCRAVVDGWQNRPPLSAAV